MSDAMMGGTTGQENGDAPEYQETTENLATAGADAGETTLETLQAENRRLKEAHEKALAEKSTLERLKRENEELRARSFAPPTGTGSSGPDPRLAQAAWAARMQEHQLAAMQNPGSDSALVVGLYEQNQYLARQLQDLSGIISVAPDRQQQVRDLQAQYAQRGERISAKTAELLLEREQLTASKEEIARREAELKAAEGSGAGKPRVATRTVGVPRSEVEGKTMTMADFERRTAGMSPSEQRAFDAKLAKDGIVVTPD